MKIQNWIKKIERNQNGVEVVVTLGQSDVPFRFSSVDAEKIDLESYVLGFLECHRRMTAPAPAEPAAQDIEAQAAQAKAAQ